MNINLGIIGFWLMMSCLALAELFNMASNSFVAALVVGLATVGFLIWGAYKEF